MDGFSSRGGWIEVITGGMFSVELPESGAREIYADPHCLIAYAGGINGTLTPNGDTATVSGSWPMATGLSHAAWVAVGCHVTGGEPAATAVALLPPTAVEMGAFWQSVGLVNTGTGPLTVANAVVPADRIAYDIRDDPANRQRRRFRMLVPSAIAAVAIGIGMAALEATAQHLAGEPAVGTSPRRADRELVQDLLGRHYAQILAGRSLLYEVTAQAWARLHITADQHIPVRARGRRHRGITVARQVDQISVFADPEEIDVLRAPWCFADESHALVLRERVDRAGFAGIGTTDKRDLSAARRRQRARVGYRGDELDVAQCRHGCRCLAGEVRIR